MATRPRRLQFSAAEKTVAVFVEPCEAAFEPRGLFADLDATEPTVVIEIGLREAGFEAGASLGLSLWAHELVDTPRFRSHDVTVVVAVDRREVRDPGPGAPLRAVRGMPWDAGIEFGTTDAPVVVGIHAFDTVMAMARLSVLHPLRGVRMVRAGRGPGGRRGDPWRDEQQSGDQEVGSVHACELQWRDGVPRVLVETPRAGDR